MHWLLGRIRGSTHMLKLYTHFRKDFGLFLANLDPDVRLYLHDSVFWPTVLKRWRMPWNWRWFCPIMKVWPLLGHVHSPLKFHLKDHLTNGQREDYHQQGISTRRTCGVTRERRNHEIWPTDPEGFPHSGASSSSKQTTASRVPTMLWSLSASPLDTVVGSWVGWQSFWHPGNWLKFGESICCSNYNQFTVKTEEKSRAKRCAFVERQGKSPKNPWP